MLFYDTLQHHSPIIPNIRLLVMTWPRRLLVSPHPDFSGYFGETAFDTCHQVH